MNRNEFQVLMHEEYDKVLELNETKGADYAGNEDVTSNFKKHAEQLGIKPELVWAVYASKHWDAITTYCREGQVESEPIEGRIRDVIVYMFLLLAMVKEEQGPAAQLREALAQDDRDKHE